MRTYELAVMLIEKMPSENKEVNIGVYRIYQYYFYHLFSIATYWYLQLIHNGLHLCIPNETL